MLNKIIAVAKYITLVISLLYRDVIGSKVISFFGFKDSNGYSALFIGGIVIIGYVFICFGYYKGNKFSNLFVRQKLTKNIIILSVSTVLILKIIPLLGLMAMFGAISHKLPAFYLTESIGSTLIRGISLVLIAPLLEELVFRGVFYSALRTKISALWSVLVSALIFAFPHSGNTGTTLIILVIGIILAYVYEKTNSLRYPLILHSILNVFTFINTLIIY